jgi:hypothetical protein
MPCQNILCSTESSIFFQEKCAHDDVFAEQEYGGGTSDSIMSENCWLHADWMFVQLQRKSFRPYVSCILCFVHMLQDRQIVVSKCDLEIYLLLQVHIYVRVFLWASACLHICICALHVTRMWQCVFPRHIQVVLHYCGIHARTSVHWMDQRTDRTNMQPKSRSRDRAVANLSHAPETELLPT